jgi:hypothetical protein
MKKGILNHVGANKNYLPNKVTCFQHRHEEMYDVLQQIGKYSIV